MNFFYKLRDRSFNNDAATARARYLILWHDDGFCLMVQSETPVRESERRSEDTRGNCIWWRPRQPAASFTPTLTDNSWDADSKVTRCGHGANTFSWLTTAHRRIIRLETGCSDSWLVTRWMKPGRSWPSLQEELHTHQHCTQQIQMRCDGTCCHDVNTCVLLLI